jgi:hypothetical protein
VKQVEVSGGFANFRAVYDDLTDEVMRSHVQFLASHLSNWFHTLDTTSKIAPIIQNLQRGVDFVPWRKELDVSIKLNRSLSWPKDPEKRLATQLLLFRSVAVEGNGDVIAGWGWRFIPSQDTSINNSAQRFIDQVFRPMAAELRRHLERELAAVPAADRTVPLNHNSKEYGDTIEAAEEVEKTIREANDFPDQEEKEQRVAEISAVRRLLQAARVRVEPIVVLLKPLVELAKTKLKDNLVGTAISAFLTLLGTLLHYVWALF